jgi:hypothetical protein
VRKFEIAWPKLCDAASDAVTMRLYTRMKITPQFFLITANFIKTDPSTRSTNTSYNKNKGTMKEQQKLPRQKSQQTQGAKQKQKTTGQGTKRNKNQAPPKPQQTASKYKPREKTTGSRKHTRNKTIQRLKQSPGSQTHS